MFANISRYPVSRGPSSLCALAVVKRNLIVLAVLAFIFASFPQNSAAQTSRRGGGRAGSRISTATAPADKSAGSASEPLLGHIFDPQSKRLQTISGIPGAAVTGKAGDLGWIPSAVHISPRHDHAFLVGPESGRMLLAELAGAQISVRPGSEFAPADRIAFSPAGSSAALYYRESRLVRVVSGFPANPQEKRVVDLTSLPPLITALALSDDGEVLLAATASEQGGVLLAHSRRRGVVHVASVGRVMGIGFVPDSRDALIADYARDELVLIRDVTGRATPLTLADRQDGLSRPIAVGVTSDGRRAFTASKGSNTVLTVDLGGGLPSLTPCRCRIAGLQPLLGNGVFLLTAASDSPLYIFDGSRSEPRTLFVSNDQGVENSANTRVRASARRTRQ